MWSNVAVIDIRVKIKENGIRYGYVKWQYEYKHWNKLISGNNINFFPLYSDEYLGSFECLRQYWTVFQAWCSGLKINFIHVLISPVFVSRLLCLCYITAYLSGTRLESYLLANWIVIHFEMERWALYHFIYNYKWKCLRLSKAWG